MVEKTVDARVCNLLEKSLNTQLVNVHEANVPAIETIRDAGIIALDMLESSIKRNDDISAVNKELEKRIPELNERLTVLEEERQKQLSPEGVISIFALLMVGRDVQALSEIKRLAQVELTEGLKILEKWREVYKYTMETFPAKKK